jgi:Rod binding domain-containing protein
MQNSSISSAIDISPAMPSTRAGAPAKIREAAQQFEALLIGQLLQGASKDGGWLGAGEDSAGACATSFAEQQLALMIAQKGGMGLASLISKGLDAASGNPKPSR